MTKRSMSRPPKKSCAARRALAGCSPSPRACAGGARSRRGRARGAACARAGAACRRSRAARRWRCESRPMASPSAAGWGAAVDQPVRRWCLRVPCASEGWFHITRSGGGLKAAPEEGSVSVCHAYTEGVASHSPGLPSFGYPGRCSRRVIGSQ